MKSFREVHDCYKRKYVAVNLNAISSAQLRVWCEKNGFDITKSFKGHDIKPHEFKFHTTIFYTETYHDTQSGNWIIPPFELNPVGFEMLGENHNIPVMLIDPLTPELDVLRKKYESLGFKDKWGDFKPHVTLSYAGGSVENKSLPNFMMSVNRLHIESK